MICLLLIKYHPDNDKKGNRIALASIVDVFIIGGIIELIKYL